MKIARSITSLLLAGIVLAASMGAVINAHVCGGHVRSVALFSKAKSCMGMMENEKSNHCCKTKTVVLKAKQTTAIVKPATELIPLFDLIALTLPVLYNITDTDAVAVQNAYGQYKPPLLQEDISVLVHSLLI